MSILKFISTFMPIALELKDMWVSQNNIKELEQENALLRSRLKRMSILAIVFFVLFVAALSLFLLEIK
jgi:hypothetical protein